ncbi:MAG: WYL domain-containing protein [Actinomycetia bacterium]|nr:WYL domain-containing protein [Actinomycetes bacterium]
MPDPGERLVNLALFLAKTPRFVSAEELRGEGLGYPEDQDEAAFLRMFERDKDALRAAGIAVDVDEDGRYRVNRTRTFAGSLTLCAEETAAIRTAVAALAVDEAFPFAADLTIALAKLGQGAAPPVAVATALVDEDPRAQGASAALAAEAIAARKLLTFDYTNAKGEARLHEAAPYGIFFREGRWYLVGLDTSIGEIRVYALKRATHLTVNPVAPRTPDFERPEWFSVAEYSLLPFQYGPEPFDAVVRFSAEDAWRAPRLSGGNGVIEEQPDGGALWRVRAGDARALAAWCVEHGPGVTPLEPAAIVDAFRMGLQEVLARHDR